MIVGMTMLGTVGVRNLYHFLAVSSPVGGQFLVVEGWLPTFAYREAAEEYRKGKYARVIAVGVMREDGVAGGDASEDFGADQLVRFGVPREAISTASYSAIQRDRTFHAAMAVKEFLDKQGLHNTSVDLITLGPHARRSRLLYEMALGRDVNVGVIAVEDWRIDPLHWWRNSEGARSVISETIGYAYARIFFSPDAFRK